MASSSTWLMLIDQWETTLVGLIKASQAAFIHEKYALQLHVETNPVPFRPSTILSQLIHSEQRRGGSTKQQRLRTKNAEHLERKLESEVRQHYELESEQACAKWNKLHLYLMDDRRQLLERIEWDAKQLSEPHELTLTTDEESLSEAALSTNQRVAFDEAIEAERQRQFVESEWIHQERFNIQEAFTNQTKKIQADYQAFIEQLDAEFIVERQKIVSQAHNGVGQSVVVPTTAKTRTSQLDRQFKSNAKRHMLVQTAPVVELGDSHQAKDYLPSALRTENATTAQRTDMTQQDRQLQELEHRLAAFKEAAEDRLKDGMQWIARQCAHMFSQLDCKEAEAKLVLKLTQQNDEEAAKLLRRVRSITSQIRSAVHNHNGRVLPPLPTLAPMPVRPAPAPTTTKATERPPRRRSEPVGLKGAARLVKHS